MNLEELIGQYQEDWNYTWNSIGVDENLNRYQRTEVAFNAGGESMAINAAQVTNNTIYELEQAVSELKKMLIQSVDALVEQSEVLSKITGVPIDPLINVYLERFKVSLNG